MSEKSKFINPLARLRGGKRAKSSWLDPTDSASLDVHSQGRTVRAPHDPESYLSEETQKMNNQRRDIERQGERQFAKVNAKEHSDEELQATAGDELQHDLLQHPWFEGQRFDGIDDNTPEPALNSAARKDFDNARREQEMEKQLRLGLAPGPKFSSTPKPPMG